MVGLLLVMIGLVPSLPLALDAQQWPIHDMARGPLRTVPPAGHRLAVAGRVAEYDIVFHRPRFEGDGKLVSPARMTVFHNRVLVHDNVELAGATAHRERASYAAHPDRLPLPLQDHASPVRYRNTWVRELPER